jgi:hypothetical protein
LQGLAVADTQCMFAQSPCSSQRCCDIASSKDRKAHLNLMARMPCLLLLVWCQPCCWLDIKTASMGTTRDNKSSLLAAFLATFAAALHKPTPPAIKLTRGEGHTRLACCCYRCQACCWVLVWAVPVGPARGRQCRADTFQH